MSQDEGRTTQEPKSGNSAARWAALGTIGAAVVTAVVTLVTFYLPARDQVTAIPAGPSTVPSTTAGQPTRTATELLTSSAPASSPAIPRSSLLDALVGRWRGTVTIDGRSVVMTLDIPDSCREGADCGTMTTDLHGCVALLVLLRINDGPQFDFASVDFAPGSSSACELRAEGGDYFTLGRDVLAYATGYDGGRFGTLRRVR